MDIINFWQQQVDAWNAANYCNKCWTFGAPLTEAGVNIQQVPEAEACCVHVIVSSYREGISPTYNSRTGLMNRRPRTINLTMRFMQQDTDGANVYNEILGHPISESKWVNILQPLKECITPEGVIDFCAFLGYNVDITSWSMEAEITRLDNSYTGWRINMQLRLKDGM